MTMTDRMIQTLRDIQKLTSRNKREGTLHMDAESMTEQQFVRSFGSKVRTVRWSRRLDMVGLVLCGNTMGIWITRGKDGQRKIRALDVVDGKIHVTERFLVLSNRDSLSNLQKGLLRWIQ